MPSSYTRIEGTYAIQTDLQYDRNYYKMSVMYNASHDQDLYLYWTTRRWMVNTYLHMIPNVVKIKKLIY